jgi:hypothetical protein
MSEYPGIANRLDNINEDSIKLLIENNPFLNAVYEYEKKHPDSALILALKERMYNHFILGATKMPTNTYTIDLALELLHEESQDDRIALCPGAPSARLIEIGSVLRHILGTKEKYSP